MTPDEMEQWLLEKPFLIAYIFLILAGSLVAFILLGRKLSREKRSGRFSLSPWQIGSTDFGLFLCALVLWFVVSGVFILQVHRWIAGPDAAPGPLVAVFGGYFLQGGMLYLFLRFRFHFRSPNEGPLNPRLLGFRQSLGEGLFYFLASLPVIYGVGIIWGGFLQFLRNRGVDIQLPLQDAVLLFQDTDDPLLLVALIGLAVGVAPVVEEVVFRAGVYRFLKGKVPVFLALLISGALFGLVHGNLHSLPGLIAVGVCLGIAYELSGNLRVPIFFHALFNLNSVIWILAAPEIANV